MHQAALSVLFLSTFVWQVFAYFSCGTVFRQAARHSVRFFVGCREAFGLNAVTNCINAKLSFRQKDARHSGDDAACPPACLSVRPSACPSVSLMQLIIATSI